MAHHIPEKVECFVKFLLNAECIRQDIGLLTIQSSSHQRYFINVAGAGFDAYTGNIVNQKKSKNKLSEFPFARLVVI
jgi:diacylglycerol kinase family enzyme